MILLSSIRMLVSRRSLVVLWCGLVLTTLPLASIFAQDKEPVISREDKPARSQVLGRVIFADSEQPLRRASLRLRKDFHSDFLKRTISTSKGEFSFQGVSAGT